MISVQRLTQRKKDEQGFTVIELLIVIVVLVILIALVVATYGGIQQKNRDLTRQKNLETIHEQIEKYFLVGHYPSRADMNNPKWLAKNLPGLNPNILVDPSNPTHSEILIAKPSAKSYAYEPTQIDGVSSCESNDTTCAKYILTATYEGNVNGSNFLVIKSTN